MTNDVLATYVTRTSESGTTSRIIGFDTPLLINLILQGVNTLILVLFIILLFRICLLGTKALKIYIKNNENQ